MQAKNIILLICSLIIALAFAEFITRKTTCFPINTSTYNKTYDKELLYRMDTSVEGIDANGFRNNKLLDQAEIVTIGDSHTYGFNAMAKHSWPQVLSAKLNATVYNFSVGGYGIIQYFALTKHALKLKPKYIIIGIYLPNDLEDIANAINFSSYWQTKIKSKNLDISKITDSTQLNILSNPLTVSLEKIFFSSALASMIKHNMQKKLSNTIFVKTNKNDLLIDTDTQKTIFTDIKIKTLKSYLNLEIPHTKNSFKIAKVLIKQMANDIKATGIIPILVFIPSKENTFYEYLNDKGFKPSDNFSTLVKRERNITDLLSDFLVKNNIQHIKIKDYMDKNQSIIRTPQIYPKYDDEHVIAAGYKIYAEAIYEYLKKSQQ